MNYPDSVEYLYSLGNEVKSVKLGLERIGVLLAALHSPQSSFRSVHVAGTNGKGSTCAMIESALRACGVRTGLYTSPHLVEPTERIQVNGLAVDRKEFAAAFREVHQVAEQLMLNGELDAHPSYFETVTAMAFLIFRNRQVHTAVIETGLGGRLDATNVVRPVLAVITPIDFDHETYLGSSLEQIAVEKAGILKQDTPAVFSAQRAEAGAVLSKRAKELNAAVIRADLLPVTNVDIGAQGSSFHAGRLRFECPLAGEHQVVNAITAISALRQLGAEERCIQEGIRRTEWPGRLELVSRRPDIILDGAHNPAGARALAAYIKRFFAGREVWLVYGAMRDKSVAEIAEMLFATARRVIVTAPTSPRSISPDALAIMTDHPNVAIAARLPEALALARNAPPEAAVFVTGSLYLVGEARALLLRRRPFDQDDI